MPSIHFKPLPCQNENCPRINFMPHNLHDKMNELVTAIEEVYEPICFP